MKTHTIDCIPVHGDVRSFEIAPGPAGVVHVTVIDRDADDDQCLITGALDQAGAIKMTVALLQAQGVNTAADQLERCQKALRAIIALAHNRTPGDPIDDLAQCANLAGQALEGEPLKGDPGVYKLSRVKDEDGNVPEDIRALLS